MKQQALPLCLTSPRVRPHSVTVAVVRVGTQGPVVVSEILTLLRCPSTIRVTATRIAACHLRTHTLHRHTFNILVGLLGSLTLAVRVVHDFPFRVDFASLGGFKWLFRTTVFFLYIVQRILHLLPSLSLSNAWKRTRPAPFIFKVFNF